MTVSNAYNRPDQLSAATRSRVMAVAAELGYAGPDPTAASLRLRRTRTVGVVLTERLPYAFADPGMVTILHGLASGLSEAGYALLLVPESGVDDDPLVRHAMVDALVLCALPAEHPAVAAALERQVPVVTVGNPRLPHVPRLGTDNRAATALVARHLLDLGHRSLGFVGDVPRPVFGFASSRLRLRGVEQALRDEGLAIRSDHLGFAEHSRQNARHSAEAILARPDRPTAIVAASDTEAIGVLEAATALGLDVPGDVSVIGYDDVEAADFVGLTTVRQPLTESGERAVARLQALIEGGDEAPLREVMPVALVVRRTTGRPPAA